MAVEGCHRIIKYLMVFFNFLFFVLGITVLGFGIYAKIKSDDFNSYFIVIDDSNSTWENFGVLCVIIGVAVMLLGGSGCYGAAKESQGCLAFFAVLVFLVFVLEIVAGGMGYHYRNSLDSTIRTGMNSTFNESIQNTTQTQSVFKAWDKVQNDLKCCGVMGPNDYFTYGVSDIAYYCGANWAARKGCYEKVKDELTGRWGVLAGGAVGIAIVELLAIAFAVLLIREIRSGGDTYTVV